MKIRKGFVSNSSSSSFVCDVCGEQASGWDMSYDEAEMVCCKNGHEFCEKHLLGEDTLEVLQDEEREDFDEDWRYETPTEFCPVCQLQLVIDSDLIAYLLKITTKTRGIVAREVKEKFKTYDEYKAFLK